MVTEEVVIAEVVVPQVGMTLSPSPIITRLSRTTSTLCLHKPISKLRLQQLEEHQTPVMVILVISISRGYFS